jgi:pimeloyl-ACP methyl ester carboxylesterase
VVVETSGGRSLEVHEGGEPDGLAVIVHHGTPSSGLLYDRWVTPGIRLIAFDRAGYGGSTRDPGRAIASVAADVEAIADSLGLDRFATWGISGGGPHALACAALCGDRLTAAASVAPWGAEGLDWLAGMGEGNVEEFDLVFGGEEALRPAVDRDRKGMLETTPEEMSKMFDTLLGDADRAATTGALAQWLYDTTAHGLAENGDGWIDDDLAFVADWGFPLDAFGVPVAIWQGAHDRMVPFDHGKWLAAHVAGARVHLEPGEGHLSLMVNAFDAVVADLLTLRQG